MVVNSPLIRHYFFGRVALGGWAPYDSSEDFKGWTLSKHETNKQQGFCNIINQSHWLNFEGIYKFLIFYLGKLKPFCLTFIFDGLKPPPSFSLNLPGASMSFHPLNTFFSGMCIGDPDREFWHFGSLVDGRNLAPVEVGSLSHYLAGGFTYFLFSSLPGGMIQFD